MKKFSLIGFIILLALPAEIQAQKDKIVVRSQADLPRYTYKVNLLPSELLMADTSFTKLVEEVKKDVLNLFDNYKIEDASTLKGLYNVLLGIAEFEADYPKVEKYINEITSLEEKPSSKLMSGIFDKAIIASENAVDNKANVFRENLTKSIEKLPWEIVQNDVKLIKGSFEILSQNLLTGIFQSQFDPAVKATGTISGDIAQSIISTKVTIDKILPFKNIIVEVCQKYIDKNNKEKKDIWTERNIALSEKDKLKPVLIGIWDTGTDPSVYSTLMYNNKKETLDGKDTDGNGFVDDMHGIAYTLHNMKTTGALFPLDENQIKRYPEMISQLKGFLDIQANVDSEEAKELKQKLANMQPGEVSLFLDELGLYGNYVHGTHVAGIATAGNPASLILVVRETFDHKVIPDPPNKTDAEKWAQNFMDNVNYLRLHGVRVVNMSWGGSQRGIESALEANGIGKDSEERAKMAKEIFNIQNIGLYKAIKSVPGILFVVAAGNSNNDVEFEQTFPSNIDLPNVLVAGAVDQAGDVTSFTSFGKSVDVYSNGFEVESFVPTGIRMKMSGTSMSAPAVTNLAAKLFAIDPALTPEKVIDLIKNGADRSTDGRLLLINPKKTIGLIAK